MNRRKFLQSLSAVAGGLALTAHSPLTALAYQTRVPVPPSLMLHSRDARASFLPPLLTRLKAEGYTSTTYKSYLWDAINGRAPERPIIISIDDITMAAGTGDGFRQFARMQRWIAEADMRSVFGVITEPHYFGHAEERPQDAARWDEVADWIERGFELATHTSYHSNFNAVDSGPRADFGPAEYEMEIVKSAELIERELAHRGIRYGVQTLIMPYGTGFSYRKATPSVHEGIITACKQAHLKFVVGIVQGRERLSRDQFTRLNEPTYVGRVEPCYEVTRDGHHIPLVEGTLQRMNHWYANWGTL